MELGFDVEDTIIETEDDSGSVVHNYTIGDMEYPCFIVDTDLSPLPKYKLAAINTMLKTSLRVDSLTDMVHIYLKGKGKVVKIGTILAHQVLPFVDLIGNYDAMVGFFDADTELHNDMLLVLATA